MVKAKKEGEAPKKRGRPPKNKAAEAPKLEAAAPKPESRPSEGGKTLKLPTAGTVSRLVKSLGHFADEASQRSKDKREMIAKAEETKHVDKVALGWAVSFLKKYKKKPAAFAVSFNHFLAYLDELELPKLADEALGMEMGEGESQDDDGEPTTDAEWDAAAPAAGKPGLSIVPGSAAPQSDEVPPAPDEADKAA